MFTCSQIVRFILPVHYIIDIFALISGTGTFGRVVLTKHKVTKEYYALKILTISEIIRLKQVEHVRSEKAILKNVAHPFIVDM